MKFWLEKVAGFVLFVAAIGLILIPVVVSFRGESEQYASLPDYASLSIEERKVQFLQDASDWIDAANQRIEVQREIVVALMAKSYDGESFSRSESRALRQIAETYRINDYEQQSDRELLEELDVRVRKIPPLIGLVQAVKESGWGTSRFAQQANNLFGQRCYKPGCGMIPKHRESGSSYEVKAFPSPEDSVWGYFVNLNSNAAYRDFRDLRMELAESGEPVDPWKLVQTLSQYSERRGAYVSEISRLMDQIHRNHMPL